MKKIFLILFIVLINKLINAQVNQVPQVYTNGNSTTLYIRTTATSGGTSTSSLRVGSKIGAADIVQNFSDASFSTFIKVCKPGTSGSIEYGYIPSNYYYAKIDEVNNYATVTTTTLNIRTGPSTSNSNVTIGGVNATFGNGSILALTGNVSGQWYEVYLTLECSQSTGWCSAGSSGTLLSVANTQNYKVVGGTVCNDLNFCGFYTGNVNPATLQFSGLGTTYTSSGYFQYKVPINWSGTLTCTHPSYNTSSPTSYNIFASNHSYSNNFLMSNTTASCSYNNSKICYVSDNNPSGIGTDNQTINVGSTWTKYFQFNNKGGASSCSGTGTCDAQNYRLIPKSLQRNGVTVNAASYITNESRPTFSISANQTGYASYSCQFNSAGTYYMVFDIAYTDGSILTSFGPAPLTGTVTVNSSCTPVSITTQPQSQPVTVGQTATFTVIAGGTSPFTYQWRKNGVNISGATSSSYTTPTLTLSDNGNSYSCYITNCSGSNNTISSNATLTVTNSCTPVSVTTQPQSQSATVGQTKIFTVVAGGTSPFTYQWRKNGVNISGATSSSYTTPTLTLSDNGNSYSCYITNCSGSNNTISSNATLTVTNSCTPVSVTTQPQSQSKTLGNTATFTVIAGGTSPYTYQWKKNGTNISGATSSSYTTPTLTLLDNGNTYSCYLTNCSGINNATSNSATLTVTNNTPSQVTINNIIKNNSRFTNPKLLWSGYTNQTPDIIKICADGSNATEITFINNTGINSNNLRFLIVSDQPGSNSDKSGYFIRDTDNLSIIGNTIKAKYTHPKYLETQYKPSRPDSIIIVDANNIDIRLFSIPIQIYRAPVIMVHGFTGGGSDESFYTTRNYLINTDYYTTNVGNYNDFLHVVDYHYDSYKKFETNQFVVPFAINYVFNQLRANSISVGKVDLVGFSMGGCLSRIYLQSDPYKNKQDIHKLITINTPHFGSQWGNLFTNTRTRPVVLPLIRAKIFFDLGLVDIEENLGAIYDLSVNSQAMNKLNSNPNLNKSTVPTHTLGTTFSYANRTHSIIEDVIRAVFVLDDPLFSSFNSFTDNLFINQAHDGAVRLNSQSGGLSGLHFTQYPDQFHLGANKNPYIMNELSIGLNINSSNTNYFTQTGLIPTIQESHYRLAQPNTSTESEIIQQGFISINYPISGQYFVRNAIIPINITSSNGINRILFTSISNTGSDVIIDTLLSNGNINFNVPPNAFGKISFVVIGYNNNDFIDYDTVTININQTATLDSIISYSTPLYLQALNTETVTLRAYFNDGYDYIVDNIDGVQYELADTTIAKYLFGNLIYGKKIGNTILIVKYQDKKINIPVYVTERDTTIPPLNLSSIITEISLNKNIAKNKLKIYPNPNNGQFSIEYESLHNEENILSIYNNIGQQVYFEKLKNSFGKQIKDIDFKNMAKGVYHIQLISGNKIVTQKMILN